MNAMMAVQSNTFVVALVTWPMTEFWLKIPANGATSGVLYV